MGCLISELILKCCISFAWEFSNVACLLHVSHAKEMQIEGSFHKGIWKFLTHDTLILVRGGAQTLTFLYTILTLQPPPPHLPPTNNGDFGT